MDVTPEGLLDMFACLVVGIIIGYLWAAHPVKPDEEEHVQDFPGDK